MGLSRWFCVVLMMTLRLFIQRCGVTLRNGQRSLLKEMMHSVGRRIENKK